MVTSKPPPKKTKNGKKKRKEKVIKARSRTAARFETVSAPPVETSRGRLTVATNGHAVTVTVVSTVSTSASSASSCVAGAGQTGHRRDRGRERMGRGYESERMGVPRHSKIPKMRQ